jgi:N-acetylglucosaminyl-diphospho-decaprenol L-rhamnosyltransferase
VTNATEVPVTLSIVVVSLTSSQQTLACLQQLRESNVLSSSPGATSEVIVVDLTGDEGATDAIEAEYPCVTVISEAPDMGFARASNLGIEAAAAEHILLMDPFAEIPGRLVPDLVLHLDTNTRVAAVGPQLVDGRGLAIIPATHFPPLRQDTPEGDGQENAPLNVMSTGSTAMRSVEWLPATCMMINREALEELGGFREGFLLQFEEIDWCKRAREGGWQVHHLQTVTVVLHDEATQQTGDGDNAGELPYDGQFSDSRRAYVRAHNRTPAILAVKGAQILVRSAKAVMRLGSES